MKQGKLSSQDGQWKKNQGPPVWWSGNHRDCGHHQVQLKKGKPRPRELERKDEWGAQGPRSMPPLKTHGGICLFVWYLSAGQTLTVSKTKECSLTRIKRASQRKPILSFFKRSCGVGIGDTVHSLGAVLVSCAVTTTENISITRKASTPVPSPRQLQSWTILGLSLKSTTYFELFLHVVLGNSLMFIFQMCVWFL